MPRWKLLRINPFDRTRNPKHSRQPLCHATDAELFFAYREQRHLFVIIYRRASKRYRGGQLDVQFPAFSIRPPLLDAT